MKLTGDIIDIEQLEQLDRSAAWKRIRDRLMQTAEAALGDLKRTRDLDELARAQTRIETIEMVLKLPRQLIGEIRKKGSA